MFFYAQPRNRSLSELLIFLADKKMLMLQEAIRADISILIGLVQTLNRTLLNFTNAPPGENVSLPGPVQDELPASSVEKLRELAERARDKSFARALVRS